MDGPVELKSRVVVDGLAYPECPRWRDGRLFFSDQYSGEVLTVGEHGQLATVVAVPGRPSGLGWLPDGTLLVVSMLEHRLYRLEGPELVVHADLAPYHPGPSNDMTVDEVGRAYVGNIGFDFYAGEAQRTTSLVRVDPDSSVHVVADELLVPNGMALVRGGSELVVAESFSHRLTSFDVADDGALSRRRTFAAVDGHIPDGICADGDDAVWFASIDTRACLRVDRAGRVTHRVSTGDRHVFACALGGAAGRTLFLCTSRSHDPEEALALRSGAIEVVELPSLTHM